jgi:SAM-dependent methyltransferase
MVVDWLLPAGARTAVDLGAGTGLLSRALAAVVAEVIAVEPDPRMRAVLAARSPGVRVLEGTGEAIPLPDASADAVLVSSAWHWMDPELAIPEVARVLRDGGRFGVLWSHRDHESGWLRDLGRAQVDTNTDPTDSAANDSAATDSAATDSATTDGGITRPRRHEITLPEGGLFGAAETRVFTFTRTMNVPDFVDWHATYSRMITAPRQRREAELARLRAALADLFPGAGEIEVPMRARVWRADRVPRQQSLCRTVTGAGLPPGHRTVHDGPAQPRNLWFSRNNGWEPTSSPSTEEVRCTRS